MRGLAENLLDAMEEQYYSELKHSIIGYRNVMTLAQLEHLDDKWTLMNPKKKKLIKKDYERQNWCTTTSPSTKTK